MGFRLVRGDCPAKLPPIVPSDPASVFISYAQEDKPRVRPLADFLVARGWAVWWDEDIPLGKTFDQVIEEVLNAAKCVIVVWSRESVRSEWVRNEASEALARKVLVPVMIDDVKLPLEFRRLQTANLAGWEGQTRTVEVERLLKAVQQLAGTPERHTASKKREAKVQPPAVACLRELPQTGLSESSKPPATQVPASSLAVPPITSSPTVPEPKPGPDPKPCPTPRPQHKPPSPPPPTAKWRTNLWVVTSLAAALIVIGLGWWRPWTHTQSDLRDGQPAQPNIPKPPAATNVAVPSAAVRSNAPPTPTNAPPRNPITLASLGLELVPIEPGTFLMGSPTNEADRETNEGPQTQVRITKGFWMGKHEVTQGQYEAVMGTNPSRFKGDRNLPVEYVSWRDATNFCARLTEQERQAGRLLTGHVFRLPTEAEWEYACRAGTKNRFSFGDDPRLSELAKYAWYSKNSTNMTHGVGLKLPNAWGLRDMHGNVGEWCLDWYSGSLPGGSVSDPKGPPSSSNRVFRSGLWNYAASDCRSAYRGYDGPGNRGSGIGFRLLLAPAHL